MKVILDIEGNNLYPEVDKVWCIVCMEIESGDLYKFKPANIDSFILFAKEITTVIGHNIIGYDLPTLKKVLGVDLSHCRIIDTLVLSRLMNPDREGGHSLAAWGKRLGNYKGDFKEFTEYSEEMLLYCEQDVRVTYDLFMNQKREGMEWDWSKSYAIEVEVAKIINEQEEHGVKFDRDLAESLLVKLDQEMEEIEQSIEPLLPPRAIPKSKIKPPPKKKFKKDGTPSELAKKYFGDKLVEVEGEWYVGDTPLADCNQPLLTHEKMTLTDHADIKKWLMEEYGWKPTMWNYSKTTGDKTSPKFTTITKEVCPDLERLSDKVPWVKDLVLWLSLRHRRTSICSFDDPTKGWINHPRLDRDGRIPSSANTIGTNTGRFSHKGIANIPRPDKVYGREMRSLFTVDDDYYMIGWDASGLEARIEAHYTYKYDKGRYAYELMDGDVHSKNAEIFGCDRSTAKNGKYALTYGARAPRLAATIGCDPKKAEKLFNDFWEQNYSLRCLRDNLTRYWKEVGKEKFIKSLDGRKVMTRAEYSLVNALFQSSGIICMKKAMVLWYDWVKKYDAHQIIHYHDEAQAEVNKSLVEWRKFKTVEEAKEFDDGRIWSDVIELDSGVFRGYSVIGELGVKSIREAGRYFGLHVPLDAEYKIGKTWADTH